MPEEGHRVGDNLVAAAGDGVVFALDDPEGGRSAVGLQEALAAPHRYYAVIEATTPPCECPRSPKPLTYGRLCT